ncbi:hypothetical protein Ancab_017410 [Ancistrocladus abbreviatus]
MSDFGMYELDNIAWDEFGESDDHIVPHSGAEQFGGCSVECQSHKRTQLELTGVGSNVASKNVCQRKRGTSRFTVKAERETMLERGSWSHLSDGAFAASCDGDSNKRASNAASEDSGTLNHCLESSHMDPIGSELCADDPILGGQGAAMDDNLYHYPLSHVTSTEADLNLFNTDHQDKESGDLLYYGWSDIENFEDVDRMFRSCDSTFGLGVDNEDELGWFPSSHPFEGSNDALKSGFKFSGHDSSVLSNGTQCDESSKLDNTGALTNDDDKILMQCSRKTSLQELDTGGTPLSSGSEMISQVDDGRQVSVHESRKKHQKPVEGKRKNRHVDNVGSSVHVSNLKQLGELRHSFGKSEYQSSAFLDAQREHLSMHLNDLQTQVSFPTSNYGHPSNQILASSTLTGNKYDNNSYPSRSQKVSFYASNHMQTVERSYDISFQTPPATRVKKKGLYHHHELSSHPEHSDFIVQTACCDPASFQKNFEGETEGHSEVNGSGTGVQAELESSNLHESSCMSSVVEEVSLEASSFCQLQHVMEQLDIRTKLCIRDSLYRLARSAEQRHKCANLKNDSRETRDATGAFASDETKKSTGFMDIETDTNPIDRSIAHLLFHRPSDPSAVSALEVSPFKSCPKVHASSNGHPTKVEKAVSEEDKIPDNVAAATDDDDELR